MSNTVTFAASLPSEVEHQALVEAERFYGEGPVAVWQPAPTWSWHRSGLKRALWGTLGLAAIAAVATTTLMWAWPSHDPAIDVDLDLRMTAGLSATVDVTDEPPPATRPSPSSLTLNITRIGREWRIEAAGVSRLAAAQRLAQISGSPLEGDVGVLADTRPLDLRWQGPDLATAWRALLGNEVNFATHCAVTRCRVWLLNAHATQASPQAAAPLPRPITVFPTTIDIALAPPASDSPDPRIAAHHD